MRTSEFHSPDDAPWKVIVDGILARDESAEESFVNQFRRSVGVLVRVRLHGYRDWEDLVQTILWKAIQQLRAGKLENPAALTGYVRAIALNTISEHLRNAQPSPVPLDEGLGVSAAQTEDEVVDRHARTELMVATLSRMGERDREILHRYYVLEQSHEQICQEMNLNPSHLRVVKSRAKARFTQLMKETLRRPPARAVTVPDNRSKYSVQSHARRATA